MPQKYIAEEIAAGKDRSVQGQNYTYVVRTAGDRLSYKVAYTSANEQFGFHSAQAWFSYLQEWKKSVAQPVKVVVKDKK
jgi:hypothetical protein